MAWKKRNASLLIITILCVCLSIVLEKPPIPNIQGATVLYVNTFDSGSDWNSWMIGEPDLTKIVPGEGSLGVVDGRLRRSGDKYLHYLGAESPHIAVSGRYQELVVRFSWHAHSAYSGPQITNMEWGFWRSDGVWWEVDVLCYGGGTDLYGTLDKDISSEVNDAIVDGCTWITIGFCFNDGRSDDWNQYVEIDDITVATSSMSRTTAVSVVTVTRSATITMWTTVTAPVTTRTITITPTTNPPVTTSIVTVIVTTTPPVTTPTVTTTETGIPPVSTATITTTVTATPNVTSPTITTATVTMEETAVSQTLTYTTYATHTTTTTATVISSLTYSIATSNTMRPTTLFYSGVLVVVLAASIIVFGLLFLMRTKGGFRVPKMRSQRPTSDVQAQPAYETLDDRVLKYITTHEGTISLAKASDDLGVEADLIKEAIQRLKRDEKLEPM